MLFLSVLLLLLVPTSAFAPARVGHPTQYGSFLAPELLPTNREQVSLQVFGTRKRVKQVYQSIQKRLRRRREQTTTGEEDQHGSATSSSADRKSLLSDLKDDQITITLAKEGETHKLSKLLGNDTTVSSNGAVATLAALELVDDSVEELPILTDYVGPSREPEGQPIINGNHEANGSHVANGDLSTKNGAEPIKNGKEMQTNGEEIYPTNGETSRTTTSEPVSDPDETFPVQETALNGDSSVSLVEEEDMELQDAANNNTMLVSSVQPAEIEPLKSLYTLPPIIPADRSLTKLEAEFRRMLEFFTDFTEADLYTIRDPRVRAIMEGVVSGSNEGPVYRAFEVLFEDLPPLRIAGRMIFSKLKDLMLKAQARAEAEVAAIVETTGLSEERVQVSRLAFLTLAIPTEKEYKDEEAHLSLEQLMDSGLAETATQLLGYEDVTMFLKSIDPEESGKVTFPELLLGLQKDAQEACALDRCDPAAVLQSVVQEMVEPTFGHTTVKQFDKKRQQFSDRYDSMVGAFQEWDDIVPEGEGRRLDVLRGCFVGAENHRVVEALRVVYLDYAALRLAGNSIFAIMKTLVGQIRKRKTKVEN